MEIEVVSMRFKSVQGRNEVSVSYWDEQTVPHNGAVLTIFVPTTDSVSEMQQRALDECRRFLRSAVKNES